MYYLEDDISYGSIGLCLHDCFDTGEDFGIHISLFRGHDGMLSLEDLGDDNGRSFFAYPETGGGSEAHLLADSFEGVTAVGLHTSMESTHEVFVPLFLVFKKCLAHICKITHRV